MDIKNAEVIIDKIASVVSDWSNYAKRVDVAANLRDIIGKTHLIYSYGMKPK